MIKKASEKYIEWRKMYCQKGEVVQVFSSPHTFIVCKIDQKFIAKTSSWNIKNQKLTIKN